MKKELFTLKYFTSGPYKKAKISGLSRFIGKYYWARRFYSKIIQRITPKKGKILEIGCGFGDLLVFLERDFETWGIDISKDAIKQAKKRLSTSTLLVGNITNRSLFPKQSFDIVIACHVLEHLEDPEKVIRMISSVLKPGGVLFAVIPNPTSVGHALKGKKWIGFQDKTHVSLYSPTRWISCFLKHGLKTESIFGDGLWDSPYIPIIPEFIQRLFFGFPAILQTLSGVLFIPVILGESTIFIVRKKMSHIPL